MKITSRSCKKITTRDLKGKVNGWLLELTSDRDGFTEKLTGQVYLTVVKPKALKGFHKHHLKTNHLTCISGKATLVAWENGKFKEYCFGEDNFQTVKVPPKIPIAIYNRGHRDAYVINACFPAFDPKVSEQEDIDLPWKPKK